jgi:hypothetical protein
MISRRAESSWRERAPDVVLVRLESLLVLAFVVVIVAVVVTGHGEPPMAWPPLLVQLRSFLVLVVAVQGDLRRNDSSLERIGEAA